MKKSIIAIIVLGILTLIITCVMNFYLMPIIEEGATPIGCFDMEFGYTYSETTEFLATISEKGLYTYTHIQLPLDFFYPLVYSGLFIITILVLRKQADGFLALPIALFVADHTENSLILAILRSNPPTESLVLAGSVTTITKTLLMYLTFALILILLFAKIISHFKHRPTQNNQTENQKNN